MAIAGIRMHVDVSPLSVDWEALRALVRSAYAYMAGRIDPPTSLLSMTAHDFARKAVEETLIVATSDERLSGCLFCSPRDEWLYVSKMAVAPDAQRQGVGRLLMDEAKGIGVDLGFRGLELETRVELIENHDAFARLGFVKVAEQSHEGYTRITNIRMRWSARDTVVV